MTSFARLILAFSLFWSSCQANGLRGLVPAERGLDVVDDTTSNSLTPLNCEDQLRFEILCQGDCNFTERGGTCESKMFLYHGGPCDDSGFAVSKTTATNSSSVDTEATCQDLNEGTPARSEFGKEVFVVITDAEDPLKNSSMWTTVGGFFWTDYRDYPIGLGLSDSQNITIYSTNETTYENMLQTMIFYAPCKLGMDLAELDGTQSVQLFGTVIDPDIRTLFHFHIKSLTQVDWKLQNVSAHSSVDGYQELAISDLQSTVGDVRLPVVFEMNRNHTLNILGSAQVITASGVECQVSALYSSSDHWNKTVKTGLIP